MPKKKTSKTISRKVSTKSVSGKHDDHSFLIILGGGFIVLTLVMLFMGNQASLTRSALSKMATTKVMADNENQTIKISNFAFDQETITVKAGSSVTWLNSDTVDHSIVADDESFDTGVLAPGEKGSYTFANAGTYTYHCADHPSMTGTVVVE